MTTEAEFEAKRAAEIEDVVAKTMRAMVDLETETKRAILTELDRWVSMEEATHDPSVIEGRRH